jgi:hypothetical protein
VEYCNEAKVQRNNTTILQNDTDDTFAELDQQNHAKEGLKYEGQQSLITQCNYQILFAMSGYNGLMQSLVEAPPQPIEQTYLRRLYDRLHMLDSMSPKLSATAF